MKVEAKHRKQQRSRVGVGVAAHVGRKDCLLTRRAFRQYQSVGGALRVDWIGKIVLNAAAVAWLISLGRACRRHCRFFFSHAISWRRFTGGASLWRRLGHSDLKRSQRNSFDAIGLVAIAYLSCGDGIAPNTLSIW